jgi:hypothetical protein
VNVARAKRTARADARRRYRAEQADPDFAENGDTDVPITRGDTERATRGTPGTPATRGGIAGAFRSSFRPLDVRGDLQAFRQGLFRDKALWIPVAVTLASTALFAIVRPPATAKEPIHLLAWFLFQYVIAPPGIGAVFVAGFLAPRASWLLGAIVGFVAGACYSFIGLSGVFPGAVAVSETDARNLVLETLAFAPVLGALFAAAAAWYRRFLQMSNPNRGRPRASSNAGRRPDGRTRAAPSKASARR